MLGKRKNGKKDKKNILEKGISINDFIKKFQRKTETNEKKGEKKTIINHIPQRRISIFKR